MQNAIEIVKEFLSIAAGVEAQRLAACDGRREVGGLGLKAEKSVGEAIFRLLLEPEARRSASATRRNDRLRGAAAAEGDHRSTARHRFHGDDAEVLFTGEEQGAAAPQLIADDFVGLPAKEARLGASQCPEPSHILPGADNDQLPPESFTGGDGEIQPLVGSERRDDEVEVLARARGLGDKSPYRRADR